MSKLLKLLDNCPDIEHTFVHTGQHFSYNLDELFYKQLDISPPQYNLHVGKLNQSLAEQFSSLFLQVELIIDKVSPEYILFLGDTNTVVSSILAARKGIKIIHIEAGMRSFDWRMPEEKNRVVVDRLSDILYVYLQEYAVNLIREGISPTKISIVGNLIVDIIKEWEPKITRESLTSLVGDKKFFFATIHREENIESPEVLTSIIKSFKELNRKYKVELLLPLMPRVRSKLTECNISLDGITTCEPVGFLECLALQKYAELVLTDSGTIQEEACILGTPCIVVRNSTERPQTFECGAGFLSGTTKESILNIASKTLNIKRDSWKHPFGNGTTSEQILADILKRFNTPSSLKPWEDSHIEKAFKIGSKTF